MSFCISANARCQLQLIFPSPCKTLRPKIEQKIRWFRDTSHGELDRRRFHKGQEQNKHISMPMSAFEFLTALNIFLSITVSLGNALILIALHVETSLHPPTKLLFRCLAITDLCFGVFSQSLFSVLLFFYVSTGMRRIAFFLYNSNKYHLKSCFMWRISLHIQRNKRG